MIEEWIKVDGIKDMPSTGEYLGQLAEKTDGTEFHVVVRHPNVTFVGGHFANDMPKVIAYRTIIPPVDIQPTVWERTILMAKYWLDTGNQDQLRFVLHNAAEQIQTLHKGR